MRPFLTFAVLFVVALPVLADEPVTLRYKAAKGDKSIYRSLSEVKQTQTVGEMKFETTINQETISSRTVEEVTPEGNIKLKIKVERLKVKGSLGPAGKFEFDSKDAEHEKGSMIGALLVPLLERTGGSEYEAVISPLGKVTEVKGYAERFADLVKENPLLEQFTGGNTNEAARTTVQDSFPLFSEKVVATGGSWDVPYEIELPKIGKLKGKSQYQSEGPDKVGEKPTAKFSLTSELSVDVNTDANDFKVTGNISTSNSSGTLQFDAAAGRVLKYKQSLTMSGQLTVAANGMNIPVTTENTQTTTLELLDKLPD